MEFVAGTRTNRVQSELVGPTCAVYLADELAAPDVRTWRLRVYADSLFVGELTTRTAPPAPAAASPALPPYARGRMVAMACSPGAEVWAVEVSYAGPIPSPRPKCEVYVMAGNVPLEPGLRPVNERAGYVTGNAAGVVQIPRGRRVSSWAAFATAAGATVDVNGLGAIPLPTSGTVEGDVGHYDGAVFTFAGPVGGYLIEYREC